MVVVCRRQGFRKSRILVKFTIIVGFHKGFGYAG